VNKLLYFFFLILALNGHANITHAYDCTDRLVRYSAGTAYVRQSGGEWSLWSIQRDRQGSVIGIIIYYYTQLKFGIECPVERPAYQYGWDRTGQIEQLGTF
jgi:hypothetical protein